MKLGMPTACLPESSLADIAARASGRGCEALEAADRTLRPLIVA
ncbi:hypothetical protein [Pseudonocardia endophytica]|uniref:Uncharacterized protein n=1 Tax=Pseudonocardia endophytica TaxID=401976 RepID=A0A4R1HRB9_PSEEN|nr:hypothetical protein [Pseudonocardia endophytica]TCK19922.1 hypothetical protein EV378_3866 [Pseudonocardia endophytica]